MIVRRTINPGDPIPDEVIEEIDNMSKYPIVFDEDCPELTEEQLARAVRVCDKPQKEAVGI